MNVHNSSFMREFQHVVTADAARMKYCILVAALRVFGDVTIAMEVADTLTNGELSKEDPEDIRKVVLAFMQ